MTASTQFKGLLAGFAAVALIGTAMAQGNPPNPAVKNAPEGAGQQSSQNTPMGTTGTPSGAPMTAGTRSTAPMAADKTTGTSSMGSSSTAADTSMASSTTRHAKRHMRKARADRN